MSQLTEPLQIVIEPATRSLTVGDIRVFLSAKLLALYCFIALHDSRRITVDSRFVSDINHAMRYVNYVWHLRGDVRIYQTFGLEDESDVLHRYYHNLQPMTAKFIQEVRAQIHATFRRVLPPHIMDAIKIHSDGMKGRCTYHIAHSLKIALADNTSASHRRCSNCIACE
ncbi:hypothetical protein ACFODT_13805 [Vibrio zhugei]|uniref:Uncharacterized protein n=1 Tax=Vibrio zhugei TaxID=2479546 RepID=A0ABV7CDG6_9VIBR|nr:hypothetical protein [Vibrio zhugei]